MSTEDLERYEAEIELQLYKEYKDVCPMFSYVVETERRFYLANEVTQTVREQGGRAFIELELVVRRGGELVFCEVKSRTSERFGVPAEAVTPAKQERMRVLAARFLAE